MTNARMANHVPTFAVVRVTGLIALVLISQSEAQFSSFGILSTVNRSREPQHLQIVQCIHMTCR